MSTNTARTAPRTRRVRGTGVTVSWGRVDQFTSVTIPADEEGVWAASCDTHQAYAIAANEHESWELTRDTSKWCTDCREAARAAAKAAQKEAANEKRRAARAVAKKPARKPAQKPSEAQSEAVEAA